MPSASSAASLIASLIVGCAQTVSATSRIDAFWCSSAVAAAMHSVALWPIMWAPEQLARLAVADHLRRSPPGAVRPSPCPGARSGTGRSRSAGPLSRASCSRHAHRGDFGERVDGRRDRRVERLGVAERVLHGRHALGRRRVGQQAAAVGVADACSGPAPLVSRRSFTRTKPRRSVLNAGAVEPELARVRPPARWPPARGRTRATRRSRAALDGRPRRQCQRPRPSYPGGT